MNAAMVRAELEEELSWRNDEVRHLRNYVTGLATDVERARFRRALVVMLYAHYEGFCKNALQQYVRAVNVARLKCREVVPAIAASALGDMFARLENPSVKCDVFRTALPDDTRLHRFARRRDFISQIIEFEDMIAAMPDASVDTESNLTPTVLRKNLFRLGMPYEWVDQVAGDIDHLLRRRNRISHGEDKAGLEADEYAKVEQAAYRVMAELMELITRGVAAQQFRRSDTSQS